MMRRASLNIAAPMPRPGSKRTVRDRNVDSRVQRVADTLEEDIVLGILHPRERLVEDELCARFEIKRHVARAVLVELELRGLADRRKHIGAFVKSYAAQEVIDLFAVREILETNAARLIAMPVSAARLEALVRIQSRYDAAVKREDLRAVFKANLEFHRALFALSENKALNEAIGEYERRTHAIRFTSIIFPGYLEKVQRQHHEIIDSVRRGDRRSLVSLCRDHLLPARDAYLESYHRRRSPP
jgi:DNA-binding GntR family transcriptional regulator